MMHLRCHDCGRTLTDPESMRIGRGPECRTKSASPRAEALAALRRIRDAGGQYADTAGQVLNRMESGKRLSPSLKRFRDRVTGRLEPLAGAPSADAPSEVV